MGHKNNLTVNINLKGTKENSYDVIDGACITSGSCQNPSLTYMAVTARAAHFAVEELKKQNL